MEVSPEVTPTATPTYQIDDEEEGEVGSSHELYIFEGDSDISIGKISA